MRQIHIIQYKTICRALLTKRTVKQLVKT